LIIGPWIGARPRWCPRIIRLVPRLLNRSDDNAELAKFAKTVESVCVATVEGGSMTKDLALLVGPDQEWQTTNEFLASLDEGLQSRMD
jgi:isocitrate dehydrogenase